VKLSETVFDILSLHMLAEIWETGQEKIPYMGPAPPEGLHRYVLLLFKQVCTCLIIPAASSLVVCPCTAFQT
jgi:phosphatidylethanolamine-binding protein (PEBP) family uncharacterized protein